LARTLVVGTRGSPLALWQTDFVIAKLRARFPDRQFEVRRIRTRGDRLREVKLGDLGARGAFVDEIRRALMDGEIDLGVHSAKDLPNEPAEGVALAIVGPREDPRDALVSHGGVSLAELPEGARVGTGSPRRAALLRAIRPDLRVESIRGNVDTRVRKAHSGDLDAVVLAVAGLKRLGLEGQISEVLPLAAMLPAPGQGAIGVEARGADPDAVGVLEGVDDFQTHQAVRAEQELGRALGGGCRTPVGAHATIAKGVLRLRGVVASPDGRRVLRGEVSGGAHEATALGVELAHQLIAKGADAILAEAGERTEPDGE
jgi:hydroxymethylbilane synthase